MNTNLIFKSETGESVTTLAKVRKTGMVAIEDCLVALNIPKNNWANTFLKIDVMILPNKE